MPSRPPSSEVASGSKPGTAGSAAARTPTAGSQRSDSKTKPSRASNGSAEKKSRTESKGSERAGSKATTKGGKGKKESEDEVKAKQQKAEFEKEVMSSPSLVEMRNRIRAINAEMEIEKQMLNDLQQQKEKIDKYWEIEKKRHDDDKLVLRDKLQQKQMLEEKHDFELKVYKEKVKHLLHEHQRAITDVRIEAESSHNLAQDAHRSDEHNVSLTLRQLKVKSKEMDVSRFDLIKNLKQEQEKNIMQLRREYERKAEELRAQYRKKQKVVRKEYQERRKQDVRKIEARKEEHIRRLMAHHKQAFDNVKTYYRDITHNNLDLIKSLTEEVHTLKRQEQSDMKGVAEIHKVNKKLSQPLQQNLQLVKELTHDLKVYEREKLALESAKQNVVILEEQIKTLTWEHEILQQKLEQLTDERNELREATECGIFDAQQKAGFKTLLLEKKLTTINEDLEKTDAALGEILKSVPFPSQVVGNLRQNFADVVAAKDRIILELQDTVADMREQYSNLVTEYDARLTDLNVSLEDLGFQPIQV